MIVRLLSREYHESLASESFVNALSKYFSLSWLLAIVCLSSLTLADIIFCLRLLEHNRSLSFFLELWEAKVAFLLFLQRQWGRSLIIFNR